MSKVRELSPREVAQRLCVRLDSVYSLIWAGKLKAHKLDGRWRIPVEAVEARLKQRGA
jgi:excisionase family DNA binding protein